MCFTVPIVIGQYPEIGRRIDVACFLKYKPMSILLVFDGSAVMDQISQESGEVQLKRGDLLSSRDSGNLFREFCTEASFWLPERLSPSGWIEHAPFAFWLVETLRPCTIVELGTHSGYSFLCFCQAVKAFAYSTKAYAIDTWRGDEHAGFYPNAVLQELRSFHEPRYGAFSRLIEATFDDALRHFDDASIDLLHIDGRHYYKDVKHDFETWRPKLSNRAIVLFHDTNVRENDFGVFRLWSEVANGAPSFEFLHGNGLGVLAHGADIPPELLRLLKVASDGDVARSVRMLYSRLGASIQELQDRAQQSVEVERLRSETAHLKEVIRTQTAHIAALDTERAELERVLRKLQSWRGLVKEISRKVRRSRPFTITLASLEARSEIEGLDILPDVLTALSGPEATTRIQGFLRLLEELLGLPKGSSVRAQKLNLGVPGLSQLARKVSDSRPIAASIIIPVYNQVEYTIICLQSLLEHTTRYRFEVIVADDCSTDETNTLFGAIGGVVRVITHANNLMFLKNCNEAAKVARGDYLVFLNNDTFVLDGWLDGLLEPFERLPKIGYVGSKIIMPDGTLQEAGGIVWDDGSAWNYGRGNDPRNPEYNYLKDVDYCSGCSIAVPRQLWMELGGFDEQFAPAYYEDVDLALSVRAHGYRTIYNPTSTLIHHEGVSHGRSLSNGVKANQVSNAKKLMAKWRDTLIAENHHNGDNVFVARDRSARKPHILVVDHYVPQFDRDTGSRTIFEYMKLFVEQGFQVVFWPDNLRYDALYVTAVQALGVEVVYGSQFIGKFGDWLNERGKYFDYALLVRAAVAQQYIDELRQFPQIKVLFFGVDIHFLRMKMEQRYDHSERLAQDTKAIEECERDVWSRVDVVYHPADFEVAFVERECKTALSRLMPLFMFYPEDISDAIRRASTHQIGDPKIALFVAGFAHPPNVDAAKWLVNEIWPRVIKRLPNAILYLVGSSPTAAVRALATTRVHVTGYVSDSVLEALYEAAGVAIIPVRQGGGVKGKVLEAFRFGVPAVTTSVGTQGMADASAYCSVHDDPDVMADAVIHLLSDSSAARAQALAATQFLAAHYNRDRIRSLLALDIPEFRNKCAQ